MMGRYFTPRIRKLVAVCATTCFVGFGACTLMYRYTQIKVVSSGHCKQALEILLSHKEAVDALGPPVGLDSRFNFADRRSYVVNPAKKTFWAKLPVAGTLDSGNVYMDGFYESDEVFQVTKMDLSLKRLEKRFRIFELDDEDITVGKNAIRTRDEDELDEDIVSAIEKRKWFDFGWFSSKQSVAV